MKPAIFLIFCCLIFSKANAQLPILETLDDNKYNLSKDVEIQSLEMDVKIFENNAITKMKMVFINHSSRTLEGRLTFPLPEGASIKGYGLDINGILRSAVPVEKEKAQAVFESVERRRVDPGILEKVEGNNFRTRVYPLPPNDGIRTIEITFQQELKMNNGKVEYFLPLPNKNYKRFDLNTTVFNNTAKPQLIEKPDGSFDFVASGIVWTAALHKDNFKPQGSLRINVPMTGSNSNVILQERGKGDYYFMATVKVPQHETLGNEKPKNVGIIWDNSLSRLNADTKKEKALLEAYFRINKNVTVELSTLNTKQRNVRKLKIHNGNIQQLLALINGIQYDGGTDYSALRQTDMEEYLLFSDGISTFGDLGQTYEKPVHTIVSNATADFSQLKYLSNQTGGRFINLNETDNRQALKMLLDKPFRLLGVTNNGYINDCFPSQQECMDSFLTIVGKCSRPNETLDLHFGFDKQHISTISIKLNKSLIRNDWDIENYWAQRKIAALEVFYNENKKAISELGKHYGIVTKNTSLIVLESLDDYVKYKIPPPLELKEEYDEIISQKNKEKEEESNDLLDNAKDMIDDLKDWHSKDFVAINKQLRIDSIKQAAAQRIQDSIALVARLKQNRIDDSIRLVNTRLMAEQAKRDSINGTKNNVNAINEVTITSPYGPPVSKERYVGSADVVNAKKIENTPVSDVTRSVEGAAPGVQVTNGNGQPGSGSNIQIRGRGSLSYSNSYAYTASSTENSSLSGVIEGTGSSNIFEINSNAAYLKSFKNAGNPEEAYKLYLALRKDYLSTPTFYFDVANWFFRNGEVETGVLVLSNLTELDLENAEIYKTIAYTLKKYNKDKKLLYVTKKVLDWRPTDPQSYRDYALALEDNGQFQNALDVLYSALLQNYTDETLSRDKGIEETILLELNQLISRHREQLNLQNIDTALIADLPVDIRVVLNWNLDNVDMDLHVIDPSNEECYYSHKTTKDGGRISDDFTEGFGPEQFILKKATKGKYKIKTRYFNESRVIGSGRTTLMAEVYLYYGTSREERKIVVFQSNKDKDDEENGNNENVLIGEFEF